MQRDARAFLQDIREACEAVESHVRDMSFPAYVSDRKTRAAVEREFIIIGEAVTQLDRQAPQLVQRITDYRRVVDFRNQLTHGYFVIRNEIVWNIIQVDLPLLRQQMDQLLKELDTQ
ncbi:MAG: HepT-like ribonuclease domain-containing protein [Phycisphaeraceae bacterium]